MIQSLRKELRSKFGDDSIKTYLDAAPVPTISTGVLRLDKMLGGGVPEGRMIELSGEPSSGKTTLAVSVAVNAMKKYPDKVFVYVDLENALDTQWIKRLGVDFSRFEHIRPDFAEDALFILEAYLKSGKMCVGVVDSVAALLPETEMKADIEDANIGLQARLVAKTVKRMATLLRGDPQSVVIFINQKRARIGGGPTSFAFEPTKTTGGKALPFYVTTRLALVKTKAHRDEGTRKEYGQTVMVDVVKHKVNAGPGGRMYFQIDNSRGIDVAFELMELGLESGRIVKSGSWYQIPETDEKVQGETALKELIWEKYVDTWMEEYRNG